LASSITWAAVTKKLLEPNAGVPLSPVTTGFARLIREIDW
jgi:hypothetical protein